MKTTVVCGLLGSGKTTFIKNFVRGKTEKTVVLVPTAARKADTEDSGMGGAGKALDFAKLRQRHARVLTRRAGERVLGTERVVHSTM